ncbi:GNAT family N-acetyltransferase [Radiobacillus sp. PE A8.2]|uniref:GNAT family N-acetyltransferase n=1 Tax=Radiobacillus sp. PE A8.2 TaxID=3380349 RepID=UPI003890D032
MEVVRISDPKAYLKLVETMLLKKEASNNLPLGIVNRIVGSKENAVDQNHPYFGIVKEKGEAVYAFMQTPPHNLILADVDNLPSSTIQSIAEHLYNEEVMLPGVIGPSRLAQQFVDSWKQLTKVETSIEMEQFVYRLDQLIEPPIVEGELVKASDANSKLIAKWLIAFGEEAHVPTTTEQAEQMAARFIEVQSVYLWKVNGTYVSMVNQSRKSKHGASINAVYTPNEYKGNGYATASVAELSKRLLQQGNQFCSLFADADNPISNHIYKKMGYRVVSDSTVYNLKS